MKRFALAALLAATVLSGVPAYADDVINFGPSAAQEYGAVASGSSQGDAKVLSKSLTVFTTVGSGKGAVLPGTGANGAEVIVINNGANALLLYPPSGGSIDGRTANTPVVVFPGGQIKLVAQANVWPEGASWVTSGLPFTSQDLTLGGNFYAGREQAGAGLVGTENVFIGDRSGGAFTGTSSFNVAVGHNACGIGGGAPFTGSNNACLGTDAGRNLKSGNGLLFVGPSAGKSLTGTSVSDVTAVGVGSMQNLVDTIAPSKSAALGFNACIGASNAAFYHALCLGSRTGGALTTGHDFTLIGSSVGNTTFATGSGVILIGSGAQTVDTPAANTANYINIENVLIATGTNTPATSNAAFAGALQVGSTTAFTLAGGELGFAKISASGSAPGAGSLKLSTVAGTNAGTCKLIAYAGTSTTPVTVVDNVGSGC